ncbi:FMN-binding negative transcriptional regulator [Sphingopyxis terrae]|uniref:FMN-binding negative transcriptional regulator n=1 Tax=Sphingopyxis terrae TaxID=33052 RepID=UPI003F7E492C
MNPLFDDVSSADARALIADHPLAWVLAPGAGASAATQLPLVAAPADDGEVRILIGHMARTNPLVAAFGRDPGAIILFSGPQGYISPEHAGRRDWAPTWNYAHLRIAATLVFTPDATDAALDILVDAMERERAEPWTSGELGPRYEGMRAAIIGFEARVSALEGRFKLGQDEQDDTLRTILSRHPDRGLVAAMRRRTLENRQ